MDESRSEMNLMTEKRRMTYRHPNTQSLSPHTYEEKVYKAQGMSLGGSIQKLRYQPIISSELTEVHRSPLASERKSQLIPKREKQFF